MDGQAIAGLGGEAVLAAQTHRLAAGAPQHVLAGGSGLTAVQAPGSQAPPLGQQRDVALGEEQDLADQSVAAPRRPGASRAVAELVAGDPHRVGVLEGLHRRVHRVAHVHVDAGDAV